MDRRHPDDPRDDDELELDAPEDRATGAERRAAADADDDDADDDDADDESDDEASDDASVRAPSPAPAARRQLGPTLLVLGGGVWAIAAALRCSAPEPGPALSVSPDAAPTPGLSAPPDEAGEPALGDGFEGLDRGEPAPEGEPEPAAAEAGAASEDAADGPLPPDPLPEDWAQDLTVPKKVTYTIRHGGSIKNVANLFKIYHHEITALNPGFTLEQELPPNSKVVVYLEEEGQPSESVGAPSSGSLVGAVPMVEGPGRVLKMIPWKSWGTAHTVALLDQVLRRWALRKGAQPVLVGNMAARTGGKLEPHSTHQSGRDVDIGYMQKLPEGEELNWREMNAGNLDAAETWELLKLLRSTGQIEVIFIDSSLQKLLYEHATKHGIVPKDELPRWLEYPRSPPQRRALVQHVAGHVDHIHVRFACQPHERRCESRDR
jgi:murein endopeptidase